MKSIILAAGYATRLWPLTKDTPKPLLDVQGKPIADYLVDKISEIKEIDEIFVVTNDKFYPNFWIGNQRRKLISR
jgi:glucose-1-phosphate thymidylyltransferase